MRNKGLQITELILLVKLLKLSHDLHFSSVTGLKVNVMRDLFFK